MERIYINPRYHDIIQRQGLNTVAGLLRENIEGGVLESGPERSTYRLDLSGQGYFLKQVRKRRLRPVVEALLTFQLPHHYAWREMQHVMALQAANLDVMEVVAAGERTVLGVPEASAILVRQVEGHSLDEHFYQAAEPEQQALLVKLGMLTGRLHLAGFFSPVRMKDIIIAEQDRYVLIDRETRNPRPRPFGEKRGLEGLRRFLYRQSRDYPRWQDGYSLSYLTGYLNSIGSRWDITPEQLLSAIG